MGSIKRRLEHLESRLEAPADERRRATYRELLRRLTPDELDWLCEPGERAQELVPCSHVGLVQCGCHSAERKIRGFEANPHLREEYERRYKDLLARGEEIMRRDPEEARADRRGRRGIGA